MTARSSRTENGVLEGHQHAVAACSLVVVVPIKIVAVHTLVICASGSDLHEVLCDHVSPRRVVVVRIGVSRSRGARESFRWSTLVTQESSQSVRLLVCAIGTRGAKPKQKGKQSRANC